MTRRFSAGRAILAIVLLSATLVITLLPQSSASRTLIEPRAGAWKTWVVTSGSQIETPAPPGQKVTK